MRVTCGTVALLLCGIAAAHHPNPGQFPQPSKIHIRVVDLAGVPEAIRVEAEARVSYIFYKAGLGLDFVECVSASDAKPCQQPPGPADLWLQILKRTPLHLHGDTIGFAELMHSPRLSDSRAAVSLPMVEANARDLGAPAAEVLAAAMAHEIGHLLLNSSSHSRSGVMSPRLDRRQMNLLKQGELLFTPDQAARMSQWVGHAESAR